MTETTNSGTGGCLCGAVRYTLSEPPTAFGVCHCGMCRKFSGGIYFGVQVPPGGIAWQGQENLGTFQSSEWAERGFCKICGSSLFWRLTMDGPMKGQLSIGAGSLDSYAGAELESEIYIDVKPSCYALAGDHPRITEAEVMAMVAAGQMPE